MLFFMSFCSLLVCSSSLQGRAVGLGTWHRQLASAPSLPIYLRQARPDALEVLPGVGAPALWGVFPLTEGPLLALHEAKHPKAMS